MQLHTTCVSEPELLKIKTPRLDGRTLCLEPFDDLRDFEYLKDLAELYEFNNMSREEMEEDIAKYGVFFWNVYHKKSSLKIAVGFVQYVPKIEWWTVDCYWDKVKQREAGIEAPVILEGAKLITDFLFTMTDSVKMACDYRERNVPIITQRLGFKLEYLTKTDKGVYKVYEKRREDGS